jgi:hypothetical protein
MKSHPYGHLMKSRFDEKPLRCKDAWMKGRFDEKRPKIHDSINLSLQPFDFPLVAANFKYE